MTIPLLPKDSTGCPYLFLAPMEGVGDRAFRKAMSTVGGFDEAVTEFLRVPSNAHIQSLAKVYQADELAPIPLACQLMGSDEYLMADMACAIERKGALRIDLNCGCPSNTVTGKGAGSSLLKEPNHLYKVAQAMVQAVSVPVTVKMRSGFQDISLFQDNLLAAQESGARFITLHPRTKVDGYGPPARWDLIAQAKSILKIPLVGNGDILNVTDAVRMLKETGCDALMIGRGAVTNPFIFRQIRAHFSSRPFEVTWESFVCYFETFLSQIPEALPARSKINKLKQILSFLFRANPLLETKRQQVLTSAYTDADSLLAFALPHLKVNWQFTTF